ncbi:MAG: hypothetical protein ACOC42_02585 [Halobacteriota archaeon]
MEMVVELLGPNRRNLITLAGLIALLAFTHIVYPHRILQYAAYLTIFSVWMAWFVVTFVDLMTVTEV